MSSAFWTIPAGLPAVAAAIASVVLMACTQPLPEQQLASAKEYLAKGDRTAAAIQLKNVLAKVPDNGEARLLLGQVMFEEEDFVSAEKELGRALELKQPHERVLPVYAQTLLSLGKSQDVVSLIGKYKLFSPPAVAATQTVLGEAYLRLRKPADAQQAYAAALAAVPDYPRARLGVAMLLANEGRLDEALKQVDEIIAAEPKLAEARSLRANILLAKGDREGAKKTLREAIAAAERYLPARLALMSMLADERDFDGAAKIMEGTRALAPRDLRVRYLDATLSFGRGDYQGARQQVQELLKYLPDDVALLVLSGAIDLRDNQLSAAEVSLRKAVARDPGHVGARQLLVRTYLSLGQPGKAKEVLQPLVDRGLPQQPRLLLLAGETYLANGEVRAAAAFYKAAAEQDSKQVVARTRLGQIALATGNAAEGLRELEAAADLDAGAYQADLALIAAHLRRQELDKAMAAVKGLERKLPSDPLTFHMYGVVNTAKRDFDAARNSYEKALQLRPTYLPAAYNLAQLDILQKKPEEARKRYEAMIAREPNNEQLYLALAELEGRTGAAAKDVSRTLQRAVKANPQSPGAWVALIGVELSSGDAQAALTAAQAALASLPSDPRVLEVAGLAQETAGEINQAIATYNRLASLQPQAVQPLYRLVTLYLRQKDADKAIESLRRVQKVAPKERDVVAQLVRVYVAAGRYDEALREARAFQKLEPRAASGYALEGDIHAARRDLAEAVRLYREALKLEPKASAVAFKLHGALSTAGRMAEAEALAKKWMADNPKDPVMRRYLAQRELEAKDLKAAAAHYRAAINIDPGDVESLNNLAWIGGELNDPSAIRYAERALKLAPNDPAVLDTYGMLLVKRGDIDKGMPFIERSIKLAPARSDLRLNYAKALLKAGKKDAARKELETLQSVKDDFPGKEEVPALLRSL